MPKQIIIAEHMTDQIHQLSTVLINNAHYVPLCLSYSLTDWFHNLKTIPSSRLLKRIRGVMMFNCMWSVVVYVVYRITLFKSPGSRCHSLLGMSKRGFLSMYLSLCLSVFLTICLCACICPHLLIRTAARHLIVRITVFNL
jgi:hypothetical protein